MRELVLSCIVPTVLACFCIVLIYFRSLIENWQEDAILLRREVFPDLKTDAASLSLLSTIGRLYCHESVQRYEDALGYFHEVHRMKCELFGKRHLGVASSLNSIAFIYLNLGDYDKCVVISDRAIDIASNGRGLNKEMCVAWTNKGDAQEKLGQYVDAVASYEKVLDLQSACLSEDDIANAEVYEKMADSYLSMNDIQQATSSLEDAILVKIEALGDENEELAKSYRKLAECYEMTQDYSNSIKSHTRALRIFKRIGDKEGAAIEHNKMGGILKKSGDYNKAMEHYMASLWHSREAKLPSTNPIVADTIRNVASFQTN
jgi:tetratricopeptide (TPR) repeat protein